MTDFWKHTLLMFLALRAGDVINLAAGMWLVPKYVAGEELGAILPTMNFATFLTIPVFAFGMAVMKATADLSGCNRLGELKSLLRGVFLGIGALTAITLILAACLLPQYLAAMRVNGEAVGFCLIAAALLGSVAPVYTDAMQATKRFKSLAAAELAAAIARLTTLMVIMPFKALVGYFAGSIAQPLTRILTSVLCLRKPLAVPAERFWTTANSTALAVRFVKIALYLALPMLVATVEQSLLRTQLPSQDSAGYYMVTRLTDLINYLTYPLLIVIFPYAAEAKRNGRTTLPIVAKSSLVTIIAALTLGIVYHCFGRELIAWLPNGAQYATYLDHAPALLAITALTACQTFFTNAEVAAGRHGFLWWFVPFNLGYGAFLAFYLRHAPALTLPSLLTAFLIAAALRFILSCISARSR